VVVALCFAITDAVLLLVLERIFLMVLWCYSNDLVALGFRCFAIWALALPLLFRFVKHIVHVKAKCVGEQNQVTASSK
jgi:hypothetical protein